mmetsp:Transcript_70442/g.183455  ORF Transcript_70442/g.183455 Transcript_70442/m.183455 type:complete len:447 (+) Transcript_70442:332-1672(+)
MARGHSGGQVQQHLVHGVVGIDQRARLLQRGAVGGHRHLGGREHVHLMAIRVELLAVLGEDGVVHAEAGVHGLHHGHVADVEVLILLWHLVQRQVPAVLGLRRLHRQPRPCGRRLRPGPGHGGRLGPAALPRALLLRLGPWALHGPGLHTGHGAAVLGRQLGPLWRRPGDLVRAAAGQRAGLAVGFLPRASILVLLRLRGGLVRLRLPFGCDCLGFLLQLLLPLLLLALLLLLLGLANLALGLFRQQLRHTLADRVADLVRRNRFRLVDALLKQGEGGRRCRGDDLGLRFFHAQRTHRSRRARTHQVLIILGLPHESDGHLDDSLLDGNGSGIDLLAGGARRRQWGLIAALPAVRAPAGGRPSSKGDRVRLRHGHDLLLRLHGCAFGRHRLLDLLDLLGLLCLEELLLERQHRLSICAKAHVDPAGQAPTDGPASEEGKVARHLLQ